MRPKNLYWLRGLFIIIPWFLLTVVLVFLTAYIFDFDVTKNTFNLTDNLIVFLSQTVATILIVWIFTRFIDKKPFMSVGLSIRKRLKDILFGLLLGFVMMVFGYLILSITNQIQFDRYVFNSKQILISTGLFLLVAINEEVITRGYILRNFTYSFNKYIALILSALIFSIFHLLNDYTDWFSFLSLLIAGIGLGITYIHTQNLWFPIAYHFSWNLFQSFLGFNVSGNEYYSIIEYKINNENRLNGGYFGFEGSIYCIIFEIIFIITIDYYFRHKNKSRINERTAPDTNQ